MKSYHVGIDEAFANTGFAVLEYDSDTDKLSYVSSFVFHPTIKFNEKSDAIALLEHNYHIKKFYETSIAAGHPVSSTAVEGLSVASPGFAATRGAVWAVYALHCLGQSDMIIVSPTKLKQFATGKGSGSDKEPIWNYVQKKFGVGTMATKRRKSYDESDAVVLAEVGFYAWRFVNGHDDTKKLTDYQKEVLFSKKPAQKTKKPTGICLRLDDFYIMKREI